MGVKAIPHYHTINQQKMLVTTNFSSSHNVFQPITQKFCFFLQKLLATFKLLSANALNFDRSNMLSFGKDLSLSQTSPGFNVSAVQVP